VHPALNDVPDLKLTVLLDALSEGAADASVRRIFSDAASEPEVDLTRMQPPVCYWRTFASGRERATFKAFFRRADYESYRGSLEEYYPEQVDQPRHPRGGLLFLDELNAVVWGFPFDPLMPSLHKCVDPGWVGAALKRPVAAELVDYTPEIGAMVAYREPERRRVVAFGKASPKETCGLIYLVMKRLWDSQARREGRLKLAKPLAFRPEADLLLQSRVYGRPLAGDRNRTIFMRLADEAGRALAAVHGADVPFGSERKLDGLIGRLDDSLADLGLIAPPLYDSVKQLVTQLKERAERSRPEPLVPSHGDYKYDQLLRYRQQFVLIDFELYCRAESALDLGTFCAYLPPSRPLGWQDAAAAEVLRARFLRGYERASGRPIDYARLGLHEAAMLGIRANALVTRQRDDWATRASQMLDLALERLVAPEPNAERLAAV
jgi:hypothetical protein